MLDYRIRPATADDVGFLTDVAMEASWPQGHFPDGFDEREWRTGYGEWTMEQVRGEIPDSTTSVIEVGNERVGRLRVTQTAGSMELSGIQLCPGFQRRGIGTAIVEGLQAQAAAAGIPLDLDVGRDNPDARRLYERLGFVQIGETDEDYQLRWIPRPVAGPPA